MKYKYAVLDFTPKDINEDNFSLRAVFSTDAVDRHGEIVDQKSWMLEDFIKNPVVLFGHDHSQPPIGKVIGLGYNEQGNLEGEVKFAAKEYEFANTIWNLYKGGYMKAFSVGFAAGEANLNADSKIVLSNNTLYELSCVAVPANAMALAKSKGIDTAPLEDKYVEMAALKELAEQAEEVEEEKGCPCNEEVKDEEVEAPIETTEETTEVEVEEEKGAVADEEALRKARQQKWEKFKAVDAVISALWTVYFDDNTPVKDFNKLLNESIDLLKKVSTGSTAKDLELEEVDSKALRGEQEEETSEQDVATGISKAVAAISAEVKEGKVLSKKNRTTIEAASEALLNVLAADEKKELSTSITLPSIVMHKRAPSRNRKINKAVRQLLKAKTGK